MVRSTITSLPAGIIKMPFLKYTLFTVAGMSVWTVFWLSIGYFVGEAWHQIKTVGTIVLIVVLLAIIYYLKIVAQRYIEKHLGKIE